MVDQMQFKRLVNQKQTNQQHFLTLLLLSSHADSSCFMCPGLEISLSGIFANTMELNGILKGQLNHLQI